MKRLLFITERFAPDLGGLSRSATRLVTTLCHLGVEVDVVTWSRYLQPGEVLPPQTPEGLPVSCRVHRIGLYRHWDMTMPHTLNLLDWLHQTYAYSAVWGHYVFPSGFIAVWFASLRGISSTVSARGNDIDKGMFPPGDFARLQWTLENAGLITAVSADMSRKINLLSRRNDVLVLKNAVDTQSFYTTNEIDNNQESINFQTSLRESLTITPDEVVLGFCGEVREKKGQRFLLDALSVVRTQRPACLLIIGEVRASQESILQGYKAHHPEDAKRVIVTGNLPHPEDVARYLRICDVYLQPSLWDGMPNGILEAMACGCCCIGSDAGGIPEVITHGKNGFLLPRSQLHKLGTAVLEYLAMSVEKKKIITETASFYIRDRYSLEQEKLQLKKILKILSIIE
ncbi:MAG: glycosyltransferase family 4 protein [Cyanobacteria bacterium P01_A01_bin.84]